MNAVPQFVVVSDSEAVVRQEGEGRGNNHSWNFPFCTLLPPSPCLEAKLQSSLELTLLLQEEVLGAVPSPKSRCEAEFQHPLQQQLSWDLSFLTCVHVSTDFFLTDPFGLEESPG